jgi:hypothetical protein
MRNVSVARCLLGFVAGALAVLIFHQGVVAIFYLATGGPRVPYSLAPTDPLGVPAVLSSAFFGGLWGALMLSVFADRFERRRAQALAGLLFGAVLPSAVALFLVFPLKGKPLAGGWDASLIGFALLVNGAWGIGTVLLARVLKRAGAFPSLGG